MIFFILSAWRERHKNSSELATSELNSTQCAVVKHTHTQKKLPIAKCDRNALKLWKKDADRSKLEGPVGILISAHPTTNFRDMPNKRF